MALHSAPNGAYKILSTTALTNANPSHAATAAASRAIAPPSVAMPLAEGSGYGTERPAR
jgi:hypothetical protein